MVEDPDANTKPVTHFVAVLFSPTITSLDAGLQKDTGIWSAAVMTGAQGGNVTGSIGWYGPHPPAGDKPHHYHFQVFALDAVPDVKFGFNRQGLLDEMQNHVLAKGEIVGIYKRTPDVRDNP